MVKQSIGICQISFISIRNPINDTTFLFKIWLESVRELVLCLWVCMFVRGCSVAYKREGWELTENVCVCTLTYLPIYAFVYALAISHQSLMVRTLYSRSAWSQFCLFVILWSFNGYSSLCREGRRGASEWSEMGGMGNGIYC